MILIVFIVVIKILKSADSGSYNTINSDNLDFNTESKFIGDFQTIFDICSPDYEIENLIISPENDLNHLYSTDKNPNSVIQSDNPNKKVTYVSQCNNFSACTNDWNKYYNCDQTEYCAKQTCTSEPLVNNLNRSCISYENLDTFIDRPYTSDQNAAEGNIFCNSTDFDTNVIYHHDSNQYNYDSSYNYNFNMNNNNLSHSNISYQNVTNETRFHNFCQNTPSTNQFFDFDQPTKSLQFNTNEYMNTNYNFDTENSKFDSQNKTNQSVIENFSNISGIDINLSYKSIVSQDHIDFIEAIIENINDDCNRLTDDQMKKTLLIYFLSDCTKFLEEIKKFNLQNLKACTSKSEVDKFSKNLDITEETKLFLDFLSSLNPEDGCDGKRTKYYQRLFSHIDTRIRKQSHLRTEEYYNKTAASFEKLEEINKKRKIGDNKDLVKIVQGLDEPKKRKIPKNSTFKRALFSKTYFYILYLEMSASSHKLLRYEYKNNNISDIFSVEELKLESEKIMQLSSSFRSIFLDYEGTLYIHTVHKNKSGVCLYSCIKKVKEYTFNLNPKIDEKEDLVIRNVVIDKFIVYIDKIYLLESKNKRMLIYGTDFKKQNEIKFKTDQKIEDNAKKLFFVIQNRIIIIIDFIAFIWRIDSENNDFEELKTDGLNKIDSLDVMYYEDNRFICRCNYSPVLYIYKILNIKDSPYLKREFIMELPQVIGKKKCEIFKFLNGEFYCAFFDDEKNLKIITFDLIRSSK